MSTDNNKGLDAWNERLDKNLEPEKTADELADARAEAYSAEEGSGDQSDAAGPEGEKHLAPEYEDNLAQNQPKEQDPTKPLSREE